MIPKRLSNKGVKKSRLKFNPVLALIHLRTTGPWSLNPLEETLLQSVLKSFITVFIQYNEGLENKLTRAPLLGLAKSIYYGPAHKFLFYLWQSRIDFQLIIKYIAVHVRHFCEGVRIVVLTAHV